MQIKAASVWTIVQGGAEKEYTDVQIILSDFGVYIKEEDELSLITWEKIISIKWTDLKNIERVWAEAVFETLEDMLDEEDMLFEEEPESKDEAKDEVKPDDPGTNPYQ